MFVRFRQTTRRLQASLISTRREGAKVRHEHVASLGSVLHSPSAADRITFWTKLHQRLDALGNRIDASQRGAILAAIHARIPMPTLDDQRAVLVERAQVDVQVWDSLAGVHAEHIEGQKSLLATVQRTVAQGEPAAADTAAKAQAARERLARAEQGEVVAGIVGQPLTRAELREATGMTEATLQHLERLAAFDRDTVEVLAPALDNERQRAERLAVRRLHRALARPAPV